MKNRIKLGFLTFIILLTFGCKKDPFYNPGDSFGSPSDLVYASVVNAREYASIRTGKPTVDTDGLIPYFELVAVRDASGNELTGEYLAKVSIIQPDTVVRTLSKEKWFVLNGDTIKKVTEIDSRNSGVIVIGDNNPYGIGDYTFDLKVTTTTPTGDILSTTFDKAFSLNVGPELISNLLYWPLTQNLVVGGSPSKTTTPFVLAGNKNVTYSLGSDTEKLTIDPANGTISLKPGYTVTVDETITPQVLVTSNISNEVVKYQDKDFLQIVISNTPVAINPADRIHFFYPDLAARSTVNGYTYRIIQLGSMLEANVWTSTTPTTFPGVDAERPAGANIKGIFTNAVVAPNLPHESWVIMNSQNISLYKNDFNCFATFYIQNQYVEYLTDGSTPSYLRVKVSTDYTGDQASANWTDVNDVLTCAIISAPTVEFTGLPYPGDQVATMGDPDGLKNPARNADAKWVKCVLDLSTYKISKNFTLAFHFLPRYTGPIVAPGRIGRYYVSDVHYTAIIKNP